MSDATRLVQTIPAGPTAIISATRDNFKQAGIVDEGNPGDGNLHLSCNRDRDEAPPDRTQSSKIAPGRPVHIVVHILVGDARLRADGFPLQ